MVPAAMPASRAMSETRELQYPFRAKTRTAASTICRGLSGSRIVGAEPRFILWKPRIAVKRNGARLDGVSAHEYDRFDGHQISHRHHAGPVAAGTRRRRVPLDAVRLSRAKRHRFAVAVGSPLFPSA